MSDLSKDKGRDAELAKAADECFARDVQDSRFVLQMMSQGGNNEDMEKHSPCIFCRRREESEEESCPNGIVQNAQKLGPCLEYLPKFSSSKAFEIRLRMYFHETPATRAKLVA